MKEDVVQFGMHPIMWLSYIDIERGYIKLPIGETNDYYQYIVRPGQFICIRWQVGNQLDQWSIHPKLDINAP